jgi:uncharacterized protein (TIGR01777 family)
MKIVIPGGSGQVGRVLERHFASQGHEVMVVTRGPGPARWDGRSLDPALLDGADVVVNLAGRSVNCRYDEKNRREIMDSRVDSTRAVGEAIAAAADPPKLWLQASTATIYAHRFDAPNDEATGVLGGGEPDAPDTWRFSIDVARAWERAALESPGAARTRLVLLRSAMTMSPDRGGIFDTLLRLVRFGLGGTVAGGRQYMSWIHHADFARSLDWLIAHDDVSGPVNVASPNPLPQREFMRVLRQAWGARIGVPGTAWMLEIAALLHRTESELVLKSRRVVPGLMLDRGFAFEHSQWDEAARDLVAAWRNPAKPVGGITPRPPA